MIACHFSCVCYVIYLMEGRRITIGTLVILRSYDPTISLYNMLKKYFNPVVIGSYYLLPMMQTHTTKEVGCTKQGKKSLSLFFDNFFFLKTFIFSIHE